MKNSIKIVLSVFFIGLIWYIGHRQDTLLFGDKRNVGEFDLDSSITSALNKANGLTDYYQGVDVEIAAVKWENAWFTRDKILFNANALPISSIINPPIRGKFFYDRNTLDFDPDLPDSGKPNLKISLGPVQHYKPPSVLSRVFHANSPIDSYTWNSGNKLFKLDLWLLEFDFLVYFDPSSSRNLPGGIRGVTHPITNMPLNDNASEINSRYDDVTILLKITPKPNAWIVREFDKKGMVRSNKNPAFGIFAVECVNKIWEGDPRENRDQRTGSNVIEGQPNSLYPDISTVDKNLYKVFDSLRPEKLVGENSYLPPDKNIKQQINNTIFGKSVFIQFNYPRIGSWQDGSFLGLGRGMQYSDREKLKFVIHTAVIGDWELRRPELTWGLKEGKRTIVKIPSLLDRLLPSFGFGKLGQTIFLIMFCIITIFILSVLLPPVRLVLRSIINIFKHS